MRLGKAGRDVPIEEIAEHTGYSATSGGFRNSLSRLRSFGLAHGPRHAADLHPTRRLTRIRAASAVRVVVGGP